MRVTQAEMMLRQARPGFTQVRSVRQTTGLCARELQKAGVAV